MSILNTIDYNQNLETNFKLKFILEREKHLMRNISIYYTQINIILLLAGLIAGLFAFITLSNISNFHAFFLSFLNLILVIIYASKIMYSNNFKKNSEPIEKNRDPIDNEYDLTEYHQLLDPGFKIELIHFLTRLTKVNSKKEKMSNSIKKLCLLFVNFFMLFIISVFMVGFGLDDLVYIYLIQSLFGIFFGFVLLFSYLVHLYS